MKNQATDVRQQLVGGWDSPIPAHGSYANFQLVLMIPTGPGHASNEVAGDLTDYLYGISGKFTATFNGTSLKGTLPTASGTYPIQFTYHAPNQLVMVIQGYPSQTLTRAAATTAPVAPTGEMGIFVCYDYVIYRLTNMAQKSARAYADVLELITSRGYRQIGDISAPLLNRLAQCALLPMNPKDVFLMPSHTGIVNDDRKLDHFLQALGSILAPMTPVAALPALQKQLPDATDTLLRAHANLKVRFDWVKMSQLHKDPSLESGSQTTIPTSSIKYFSPTGFSREALGGTWSSENVWEPEDVLELDGAGPTVSGSYKVGSLLPTEAFPLTGNFDGFRLTAQMGQTVPVGALQLELTVDDDGYNLSGSVKLLDDPEATKTFRRTGLPPSAPGKFHGNPIKRK